MMLTESDIERSDKYIDWVISEQRGLYSFDKKITFDAYSLYPDTFKEVINSVNEYNKSDTNRKFRFIKFNFTIYDLNKFTGDTNFDLKNGISAYEHYEIVNIDIDENIINPVWDIDKGIWVEGDIKEGRGQTSPYLIYDLGDLVLSGMKKSTMVVLRDSNNSVLCVEHMKCKNKFSLPAGTIEENEKVEDAAVREMKEELNLDLSKYDLEFVTSRIARYDRVDGMQHYLETILNHNKTINKDDIKNMEPVKHPKLMWVNTKEFAEINKDLFTESTYEILTGGLVKWDI